jgi:hypothetical protein
MFKMKVQVRRLHGPSKVLGLAQNPSVLSITEYGDT